MARKKKRSAKTGRKKKPRPRSAVALTMAQRRRNAGPMVDKKKKADKMVCRGKVKEE